MSHHDNLQRFLFENVAIRGNLVQLDTSWQAILEQHAYPEPVQYLLGQMLAASVLLSSSLKFNSRIIMQIQGNGAIPMLVTECGSDKAIRAIAHFDDAVKDASLKEQVGDGQLVITLEPQQGYERYQSIVELVGDTLSDSLTHYLLTSEQLETRLFLFADSQHAAGLMIQKLPDESEQHDDDAWERVSVLSETLKADEIKTLSAQDIIHRLYHEEDVRIFEPEAVFFRCPCSKKRVANMLKTLGHEEVTSILQEQGQIDIACEFCNHKYVFDAVDSEQLFAASTTPEVPTTRQ